MAGARHVDRAARLGARAMNEGHGDRAQTRGDAGRRHHAHVLPVRAHDRARVDGRLQAQPAQHLVDVARRGPRAARSPPGPRSSPWWASGTRATRPVSCSRFSSRHVGAVPGPAVLDAQDVEGLRRDGGRRRSPSGRRVRRADCVARDVDGPAPGRAGRRRARSAPGRRDGRAATWSSRLHVRRHARARARECLHARPARAGRARPPAGARTAPARRRGSGRAGVSTTSEPSAGISSSTASVRDQRAQEREQAALDVHDRRPARPGRAAARGGRC